MKGLTAFILGVSMVLLSGCASVQRESAVQAGIDLQPGLLTPINSPAIGMFQSDLYMLWYNARGQLLFKYRGQEQIVSEGSPAGAALSHIVHYSDDHGIYIFWRPKLSKEIEGAGSPGDKLLYFRASYNGQIFDKIHRLNQKGGAFLPKMAGNGRGDLYTVWTDERASIKYDLYLNVSHDYGRSWKDEDIRIDTGEPGETLSIDPTIAAERDNVWIAWTENLTSNEAGFKPDVSYSMMFRGSLDKGETWDAPVVISREKEGPTGLSLIKMPAVRGNRLVFYWHNQYEFRGAYSEDGGRTWTMFAPVSGFSDASELMISQDPSGKVHIVAGVRPDKNNKEDLFSAFSDDGVHFSNPVRLDTNTPHMSTSTGPQIATDENGNVLVVWHDFRNFRSEIYLNYSADGGKSWLKEDQGLRVKGVRHSYNPRIVADGHGGFNLLYLGYHDDKREQGKLFTENIVAGKPGGGTKSIAPPDEARLWERVAQFWDSRAQADWGKAYDLMDPYYRNITTREYYIANQLKTIYHAFEIKKADVTENKAAVKIKYTVEVPKIVTQSGQTVSVPKREEEIQQGWIWVDGDWFCVFKDVMGGTLVPY